MVHRGAGPADVVQHRVVALHLRATEALVHGWDVAVATGQDLVVDDAGVAVTATARTADRTGVEMEALTAVSVACLTLVDMTKAVDPRAVIGGIRVETKTGGKKGDWAR